MARRNELSPVAVVDTGSNSVRLVVYEGATRAPTPLFNEKVLCGLGRSIATTGRLGADAVARALRALRRFRALIGNDRVLKSSRIEVNIAELIPYMGVLAVHGDLKLAGGVDFGERLG
jgi:exopolyphosphatase/guanosine-5'-triphosphate,3'-diphosphate pyrophosphatase